MLGNDKNISDLKTALRAAGENNLRKSSLLDNLGFALEARFNCLSHLEDLDRAILSRREAVQLTADSHLAKPFRLHHLANVLKTRFFRLRHPQDLEDAISSIQKAIELTPDGHPVKLDRLDVLGTAFQTRFDRLGNLEDLENAVLKKQQAVDLTPDGHQDKPRRLRNLGNSLKTRFDCLGDLKDLEDAILSSRKAVKLTPDGHPAMPGRLSNLGIALQTRFEHLGHLGDLEGAISSAQKAAELQTVLFGRFGRLEDLDGAILRKQEAADLTPDDHFDKPRRLSNLGNAFKARFGHLGHLEDLDKAISNTQRAVELTPDGHPERPCRIGNLGNALQARFDRFGDVRDLETAISRKRKAVELLPNHHTDKPNRLNNLGNALETRFQRFGRFEDLEDAISRKLEAVKLTPDGHRDKPGRLNNLGLALHMRFNRRGSRRDLEDAISKLRKAVELAPDGHRDKPGCLSNLGNALETRFALFGRLEDLEEVISTKRKAVELTPDGHPDKPGRVGNLGNALEVRYDSLGTLENLEDAISLKQKAVELTPFGHPDRPSYLYNLGVVFQTHVEQLNNQDALSNAFSAFSEAAKSPTGSPRTRFDAVLRWAQCASLSSLSPLLAFERAINLLPQIVWLGLSVADQHTLLVDVEGVARDAVAAAIESQRYETAVEWAEQGRSIVWQNLLSLRTPLDDLHAAHPKLADRLKEISRLMEAPDLRKALVEPGHDARPMDDVAHMQIELATKWEEVVEEIRSKPGFEGFLKAKRFDEIAPAAHEGPVVILNIQKSRCDALILISDDRHAARVVDIPLKRFSFQAGLTLSQRLKALLSSARVRMGQLRKTRVDNPQVNTESVFTDILGILWLDVVQPIIEGLKYPAEPDNPRRIWWCPTGPLTFLPIHAAGQYTSGIARERVSDYFISSYVPTLTTLLSQSESIEQTEFKLVTVAMSSTPAATSLPYTTDEVKLIHKFANPLSIVNLTNESATKDRVLLEFEGSNWLHLACHGEQNANTPMKSGLLLHDGKLELSEIIKVRPRKADFAFLSACQTAMGDEKVADQSMHLAAGMLFAGYRGIIATMWSIHDKDAPLVAQYVYEKILEGGKPNRKKAAGALQEAVRRLEVDSGAKLISWVPFIHIGR